MFKHLLVLYLYSDYYVYTIFIYSKLVIYEHRLGKNFVSQEDFPLLSYKSNFNQEGLVLLY